MSPSLPKTYKALVVKSAGGPLEMEDIELKLPEAGHVLVKVIACGVCHSDAGVQQGHLGPVFPRIPGHELVGDVVGSGVTRFSGGERVGGPWHGGECHRRTGGSLPSCSQ
jgi:D-arabinose 1-dehydrogenase-like Zn-dependent alcohol dehydrogenase